MTAITVLFVAFMLIGLFARKFDNRTRLLIFLVAAGVVIYVTFIES